MNNLIDQQRITEHIMKENIKSAAELINNADAILIGAGAGIGVDSGLPDFRGKKVSGELTLNLKL